MFFRHVKQPTISNKYNSVKQNYISNQANPIYWDLHPTRY